MTKFHCPKCGKSREMEIGFADMRPVLCDCLATMREGAPPETPTEKCIACSLPAFAITDIGPVCSLHENDALAAGVHPKRPPETPTPRTERAWKACTDLMLRDHNMRLHGEMLERENQSLAARLEEERERCMNLSMGFEPLLEILQKRAGDEVSGWFGSIRIDHKFTDALTLARSASKGNEVEALTRLRARQNELERENATLTAQLEEARRALDTLAKGTQCHGSSGDYGRGFQYHSEWTREIASAAIDLLSKEAK